MDVFVTFNLPFWNKKLNVHCTIFVLFMYPCVIKSSMCIVLNYIYHGFIFITMCASIFFESKRQLHNGFIGKCQEPFFKEHNNCSNQSINAYRIVASTNMCHFSENQIFTVSNSNTPIFFRKKNFFLFLKIIRF